MFEVLGFICIGIALILLTLNGMAKEHIPDEVKVLRSERDDLLAQATAFFEADDYELLPELFIQIAEVSHKLGDHELAEGFTRKAEEIRSLFISRDAPLEPEILTPKEAIPSASSFNPSTLIKSPPLAKPSIPQFPAATPIPAIKLGSGPVLKETPSKKPKDALTEKIEKLKNLLNSIPTSELSASSPKIPSSSPINPIEEAPSEEPQVVAPNFKIPVITSNVEPPFIAPDEEPPLVAPNIEPLPITMEEKPGSTEEYTKPITTDELLNILGLERVKPTVIQPTTKPTPVKKPPNIPPSIKKPSKVTPAALPSRPPKVHEFIDERRTEQGEALDSGIVPKIVKKEEDVISEILAEKLPLLPENEKQKAIEKILTYSAGAAREAWLKVFLIKNKQYAKK